MSNQTNKKIIVLLISLITISFINISIASVRPFNEQQQIIDKISEDINTPSKRNKAIQELLDIVNDITVVKLISFKDLKLQDQDNVQLRQSAVEKLVELKAIEAKDILKNIADQLRWHKFSELHLKWTLFEAYWKIQFYEKQTKEEQIELLLSALDAKYDEMTATCVNLWAADELANMGVESALHKIITLIKNSYGSSHLGEQRILICTTKIKLLTKNKNRFNALNEALQMEDPTQEQELKKWAIIELGKLNTEESRSALIAYALYLQKQYYDEKGNLIQDKVSTMNHAAESYNRIIKILGSSNMADSEMEAIGLKPDIFFGIQP